MSATPFMQLYIADYLGDTQHLTTEQHGAYLLLLMAMWRSEGRLPNDAAKLARIARVSPRRWHLIADDIMAFFDVDGDTISQKRLVREHKKVVSISEKRSSSGKLGGSAKALKNKDTQVANASDLLQHSQIPEPEERDIKNISLSSEREFEAWYEVYPKHVGKGQARKAYRLARKKVGADVLIAGASRAATEFAGRDKQYIPMPATWLNGERWADSTDEPIAMPGRMPAFADKHGHLPGDPWYGVDY